MSRRSDRRALATCLVIIAALAAPAMAAQRVWNGATSSNFSDPRNWNGGVAPQQDDDLYFPNVPNKLVWVDALTAFSYNSLVFDASGYRVEGPWGSGLRLFSMHPGTSAVISVPATGTNRIDVIVVVSTDRVIQSDGSTVVFHGPLWIGRRLRFISAVLFLSSRRSRFLIEGDLEDHFASLVADHNADVVVSDYPHRMHEPQFESVGTGSIEFDRTAEFARVHGGSFRGSGWLQYGSTLTSGNLTPGHDCLCGPLTLTVGSPGYAGAVNVTGRFHAYLFGPAPGSEHSQLRVTGPVNLGAEATLHVQLGYVPDVGQQFVVIEKLDEGPINGTFKGLPEGATIVVNGVTLAISYVGGDGNDVVLTAR